MKSKPLHKELLLAFILISLFVSSVLASTFLDGWKQVMTMISQTIIVIYALYEK